MLVTVMLPTRNRPILLMRAIDALVNNLYNPTDVEIIFRLDSDDTKIINLVSKCELPCSKQIIVGDKYRGYPDLHKFYNEIATKSKGEYLWLYNDDLIIKTYGWDTILEKVRGRICVYRPDHGLNLKVVGNLFPIIHRKIYETIGHISLNAHNDLWMECIARPLGIEIPIDINVLHDHYSVTGRNKEYDLRHLYQEAEFYGIEMTRLREIDIEKVKAIV